MALKFVTKKYSDRDEEEDYEVKADKRKKKRPKRSRAIPGVGMRIVNQWVEEGDENETFFVREKIKDLFD